MVRHRQASADFNQRLERTRVARGLSQEQLAKLVGYEGRASISSLEKGKQRASLELAENLARALGVSPEWLAYGHGCVEMSKPEGD